MAQEPKKAGDDRMAQHREEDPRVDREIGQVERTTAQREADERMTDPNRRAELRARWQNSVLPDLPLKAGWHRCWVSTTHPSDTPQRRMRLGYSVVRYDDLRNEGWAADIQAVKDGTFQGAVQWREMIAMECTVADFNAYMREFHFDQPMEAAQGILSQFDQMDADARERGGRVTVESGIEDLRQRMRRPPPTQFEH